MPCRESDDRRLRIDQFLCWARQDLVDPQQPDTGTSVLWTACANAPPPGRALTQKMGRGMNQSTRGLAPPVADAGLRSESDHPKQVLAWSARYRRPVDP